MEMLYGDAVLTAMLNFQNNWFISPTFTNIPGNDVQGSRIKMVEPTSIILKSAAIS